MNTVLKVFLSMSFSGGLLILVLLFGQRFFKEKISRQWQYYIWLVVVLRLLLPFAPEGNLMGKNYQVVDQVIIQNMLLPPQSVSDAPGDDLAPAVRPELDNEKVNSPGMALTASRPLQEIGNLMIDHIWLVCLAGTLGLLIRKITIYQSFIRYIHAGLIPVSDISKLDLLSAIAGQLGVKKPIDLYVNPLISSPLLMGFFHPCIVLPSVDIPERDLRYTLLHELTHYKRRDMFYKWLVQIIVCLHWFNPLVHLMSQEITKACEFSCDEAVLTKIGCSNAQDYGRTLLEAMAAVGKYKESLGAATLSENKQLLKERLGAIMNYKKKSNTIRLLTGAMTLCVIFGAAFIGVYPVSAAANCDCTTGKLQATADICAGQEVDAYNNNDRFRMETGIQERDRGSQANTDVRYKDYVSQVEQYYQSNNLPMFQMAFSRMDEEEQSEWLDRIYADNDIAFMGAAANQLEDDSVPIQHLAETIYVDGDIVFFANLTMHMSEDTLEAWLERALEDEKWAFQSVLYNALDQFCELDDLEEMRESKWAEAQTAEYGATGVTFEGKNCYYQGQLVNIFLDARANKSFYTLDMNPLGTVNIKIIRDEDDNITGVAYMTEEEVTELFGPDFFTD